MTNATITSGSPNISFGTAPSPALAVGQFIVGTGFTTSAYILSITDSTHIVASENATSSVSGTASLAFDGPRFQWSEILDIVRPGGGFLVVNSGGGSTSNSFASPYIVDVTGTVADLLFGVGPDVAITMTTISARTTSGTCTISFKRGATTVLDNIGAGASSWNITATSSPITLSTSTPQTLAAYGKLFLSVTSPSALTGLIIVISATV